MMTELEHLSYEEALVLLSPEKAWRGEAQEEGAYQCL